LQTLFLLRQSDCFLSGILTLPSAAVSSEVETRDFFKLALCSTCYLGLLILTVY